MKILIGRKYGTQTDYSGYLLEKTSIRVGQRRQITDFERSHNDVHLEFSNLDGTFTTLFQGATSVDRFTVAISPDDSDRLIFSGEVEMSSVEFSIDGETVSMNAFNLTKKFWELAKSRKLINPSGGLHEWTKEYTTVTDVLKREFSRNSDIRNLYTDLDIDASFADRPIRGWKAAKDSTDPTIGDSGRYRDLSPDTTIAELLEAFQFYYNAEFFIDDTTQKFSMKPRGGVVSDTQTDLTDKLIEDSSPVIRVTDAAAYDYIHTLLAVPKPPAPLLGSVSAADAGRGMIGIKSWMITYVYSIDDIEMESAASDYSGAYYLGPQTVGGIARGAKAGLTLPTSSNTGVMRRRLYRADWSNTRDGVTTVDWYQATGYYLVMEIADNTTTFVYDDIEVAQSAREFFSEAAKRGSVWWGYDYATGTWRAPVVDDGATETPAGKILEVTPVLRFVNPVNRDETLDFNILDMIAFFGGDRDFDLNRLVTQWQIVFTRSQILAGAFEGTNYRIGDTALTPKNYYGSELLRASKLVVVYADNSLTEDVTDMELATL